MFKKITLMIAALAASLTMFAQGSITVRGTVSDAVGPVVGVGVLQKGTSNGVATDLDGHYSITVPRGAVLEFSSIGYAAQEIPADREIINVTLSEDSEMLEETVVIGYGVQKKSDLTGAISSVKSEDMIGRTATDVNTLLGGKSAGIQSYSSSAAPGSKPSMQVRGIGSNGSSTPLYVIDGRVAGSADGIDATDIESIEILKDGASAAIYGASAGNGVILITTRRGKGEGSITYEMQLASQMLGHTPKLMNAEEYVDYYVERNQLTLSHALKYWDGKTNTDWLNAVTENTLLQRHALKFQGANDKGQYYLSLGYTNNNGMVVGDKDVYKKLNATINASYNVKKWLEVGTNTAIEYADLHELKASGYFASSNFLESAISQNPAIPVTYTLDNMPENMRFALAHPELGELLSDGNGNYYSCDPFFVNTEVCNPLIERDNSDNDTKSLNLSGTFYANFKPLSWLTATSRLSFAAVSMGSNEVAHDHFNNYGTKNYRPYVGMSATAANNLFWQWENFFNAMKSFGRHNLGLMAGVSYSENYSFSVGAQSMGNDKGELGIIKDHPLFWYLPYASKGATKIVSGGEPIYSRKAAAFTRLSYDYAGKYLLQASVRADKADLSILPKGNRTGIFPAASAGWVVSREPFMDWSKGWLDLFKVRVSWGRNGSLASLGGYSYAQTIGSAGLYPFADSLPFSQGYAPTVSGNDNLRWETSEQTNVGLDAYLFRNRLTLSADWYVKNTKDLIVSANTSNIVGFASSPINAGMIRNSGVEMEVSWRDQIGDFSYGIRGNFTTLNNRVLKVSDDADSIDGASIVGQTATRFEKDYPAWYFYGYHYTGIDPNTGDPTFDGGEDGEVTPDDKRMIGSGIPGITYGITLDAAWKGFDLVVFGSGAGDVDIWNAYASSSYPVNRLAYYTEDRWSASNPTGHNPRAMADLQRFYTSDAMVFDGSYFRIKQIQLGYTLPGKLTQKVKVSNLRLYASLEDFFTFTNYIGFDPAVAGTGNGMGIDKVSYPTPKKVIFGLNLTF